jgi:hypothetical protein
MVMLQWNLKSMHMDMVWDLFSVRTGCVDLFLAVMAGALPFH